MSATALFKRPVALLLEGGARWQFPGIKSGEDV